MIKKDEIEAKAKDKIMETILRKDSEWGVVEREACKVIEFTPCATIENGKVIASNKTEPYASVILECRKLTQNTKGFITHKVDFQHLWAAFKERGVSQNEEVIIFWSKKHLKSYAKILSIFMPKLWVMICKKGTYELMTDPESSPELQGEARFLAERPIVEWKSDVMN
jgi:hypothetical protein